MRNTTTTTMIPRSFKLPPSVDRMLDDTAKKMGLNKTAALIVAINTLAKEQGVSMRSEHEPEEATA